MNTPLYIQTKKIEIVFTDNNQNRILVELSEEEVKKTLETIGLQRIKEHLKTYNVSVVDKPSFEDDTFKNLD